MTPNSLLDAADDVGRMIQTARTDLAGGRAVDLSQIEHRVAEIYGAVSADLQGAGPERIRLMQQLEGLLTQLDALEGELTMQHQTATGR